MVTMGAQVHELAWQWWLVLLVAALVLVMTDSSAMRIGIDLGGTKIEGLALAERERFYNLASPHGAHNGKTPYEALREKL